MCREQPRQTKYLFGSFGLVQFKNCKTHQQEKAIKEFGYHRRIAHDIFPGIGQFDCNGEK
jgi:hypothetical protein